ncbi:DUF2931 family protein [Pedobacter namyangjuensis]|uniref:DUF2931 family protein n=1 Tax=Pedobacter namyangjuensis TaxID=600626 RepID=UPI000DE48E34|nr:DUF2931 family protein [Pedobacter namyangjuensis]
MEKQKKNLALLMAITAIALLSACDFLFPKKAKSALPEYTWGSAISDKYLWPMVVVNANFISPDGVTLGISDFGKEQFEPLGGKWGVGNGDTIGTLAPLPVSLNLEWLSIREKLFYKTSVKLPAKKLDSIFRTANGKQLIVGLAPKGEFILWAKGTKGLQEIQKFTAKTHDPNWEVFPKENEEDQTAYMQRMYNKISNTERDEINASLSFGNEEATDGIFNGIYTYITQQKIGQQEMLLVHKLKDSLGFVSQNKLPETYSQGDLIKVRWRNADVVSYKKDGTSTTKQILIAIRTERYKKGKLSILIEKGMPPLTAFFEQERIFDEKTLLLGDLVAFYLANSNDQDIRYAVDERKKQALKYTVSDYRYNNGKVGYQIVITPVNDPDFAKNIYLHPSSPLRLLEWQEVKQNEKN